MDDGRDRERLAFLSRPLLGSFERRVVVAPGHQRAFDDGERRDALVAVERGEIELECLGGALNEHAKQRAAGSSEHRLGFMAA